MVDFLASVPRHDGQAVPTAVEPALAEGVPTRTRAMRELTEEGILERRCAVRNS